MGGGHALYLHAEQQPAVDPDLLDVADVDGVFGEHGKEPLRDTRPVLAAHRHQVGSQGTVMSFSSAQSRTSTQPWPSTQRRMILPGTPATTQRSGTTPRTTDPAATTT